MENELILRIKVLRIKVLEEVKVGFTLDKSRDICSGPCPAHRALGTHAGRLEECAL